MSEVTAAVATEATATPSTEAAVITATETTNEGTSSADLSDAEILKAAGPLFSKEEAKVEYEDKAEEKEEVKEESKDEAKEEVKDEVKEEDVEEKKDEKKEDKKDEVDPKFAARFASLSRKEKALAEREKALKTKEQGLSKFAKAKELYEKGEHLAAAEELGVTPDDFVQKLISKEKEEAETETIDYKVKSLETKLEDAIKLIHAKDLELKQEKAATQINSFKSDIRGFISKEADKFEICASQDLTDQIYATIENHYHNHKEVLSIEEATEAVEAFYEEEYNNKWSKINKFKPKVTATEVKAPVADKKVEEKKQTRTLTNTDASTASAKNLDDMTEEEIFQLAIKKLKGQA